MVAALALPVAALGTLSASTVSSATSVSPRTSAAATAHPTYYGTTLYTSSGQSLDDAMARETRFYGRLGVVRLFYPGMPASWARIESVVHHKRVLVSFHVSPGAVLSGKLDARFRTWFNTAPTTVTTRWTYWHEPEDDAEAGQLNLTQYRAAWRHLSVLADQAHNRRLRATLILMCWTLESNSGRTFRDYYAGGRAIDVLAFDCYNGGRRAGRYRDPANLLQPAAQWAHRLGKNWGVAELGSVVVRGDDGTGRAAWLRGAATYAHSTGARFVSYFDSDVGTDYRLHDAPSRSAWHRIVQSSG